MNVFDIASSALDVEWRRLQISAENLANMNSTRSANGGVYRPMRLLSGPDTDFSAVLAESGFHAATGVTVLGVEAQIDGLRREFDPNHPHADTDGFVTYPNVDHAGEMTLMIRASRAYEANLAAISIAQDMYSRATEIGRQS